MTQSSRAKELETMRSAMGTLPESHPLREDSILFGLKHLKVQLVDYPTNPYRAIYEMVTSTWSGRQRWWNRWDNATPVGRMKVVEACLGHKTLPQALECGTFLFKIQGCTRASFDQFARHRHAAVGSVGSRDNSHIDAAIVLPNIMKKDYDSLFDWWIRTKSMYAVWVAQGKHNWQNARSILPMSMEWRFTIAFNIRGFQEMCGQRLVFCEQWDTVGTAWAMWNAVFRQFPLIAAYCRPNCDWASRCTYTQTYTLSELFGCLFAPCGRWPAPKDGCPTFNESCSDHDEIEADLGFELPVPREWEDIVEDAKTTDQHFFE